MEPEGLRDPQFIGLQPKGFHSAYVEELQRVACLVKEGWGTHVGDQAFEWIIQLTYSAAYELANEIACDTELAESAVEQAYEIMWYSLRTYEAKEGELFLEYLEVMVRAAANEARRKAPVQRKLERKVRVVSLDGTVLLVAARVEDPMFWGDLARGFATLPLSLQQLHVLSVEERRSVLQIAQIIGVSPRQVDELLSCLQGRMARLLYG